MRVGASSCGPTTPTLTTNWVSPSNGPATYPKPSSNIRKRSVWIVNTPSPTTTSGSRWRTTASSIKQSIITNSRSNISHIMSKLTTISGSALLKGGQIEGAIEQCREALRLNSDLFEARKTLGQALLAAGKPAEAAGPTR